MKRPKTDQDRMCWEFSVVLRILCFIGAMAFHMILDPVWNNFAIWVEPLALIWVIFRGKDPDHDFEKSKCNQTVILLLRSHFKAISAWYSLWHLHILQVPTVTVTVTDMFPFYYTTGHVFWCFLQICFIQSLFQLVLNVSVGGGELTDSSQLPYFHQS